MLSSLLYQPFIYFYVLFIHSNFDFLLVYLIKYLYDNKKGNGKLKEGPFILPCCLIFSFLRSIALDREQIRESITNLD